jgi:surfactin synthase thioesterase subunit
MTPTARKPIEQIDDGHIWLQWIRRPEQPAQTVVWFPFGGGMAHTCKLLADHLPTDWAVVGIEGPGRLRTGGLPIPDIQRLAEYYCDQLGKDLLHAAILIGHSVGSLVAGMVAQELERRCTPARALVMGAARPTNTIPLGNPLGCMDSDQLFDWWRSIALDSLSSSSQERNLFDLHESTIRADLEVYDSARYRLMRWEKTPAMLVLGEADHICPVTIADEWHHMYPELHIEQCDGGHLFVLEIPKDYAGRIKGFVETAEDRKRHGSGSIPIRIGGVEPVNGIVQLSQLSQSHFNRHDYDLSMVEEVLARDGAVLLQGSKINCAMEFADLLEVLGMEKMSYDLGNSPRSHKGDYIYTASEYSAALPVLPHCELSYTLTPPGVVSFCCIAPADRGGETVMVSMEAVLDTLPDKLVHRFADQGVLYVQRLTRRPSLGRTWPAMMGTEDPDQAECKLLERGLTFEWRNSREQLVIWHRGAGTVYRAHDQKAIWFNQADQWHRSTLPAAAQELGDALPHDCRLGNGDEITAADIITIRSAVERYSRPLPLQRGDVLLLDNLRIAHGRNSFIGQRELLVGLSNPRVITLGLGGGKWM